MMISIMDLKNNLSMRRLLLNGVKAKRSEQIIDNRRKITMKFSRTSFMLYSSSTYEAIYEFIIKRKNKIIFSHITDSFTQYCAGCRNGYCFFLHSCIAIKLTSSALT